MINYTVYEPALIAEECYLLEAVYWCAFKRFPFATTIDHVDRRFHKDHFELEEPFIPSLLELSAEESSFAGLPLDPGWNWEEDEPVYLSSENARNMIEMLQRHEPLDESIIAEYKDELIKALAHEKKLKIWRQSFDDYLDQFKTQICLDLRSGKLSSVGIKLPARTMERSLAILEAEGHHPRAEEAVEIPKEVWVSRFIDWDKSAVFGRRLSFAAVRINVEELLDRYPADLKGERIGAVKQHYCLLVKDGSSDTLTPTKRGRPALPWDLFHVEVARMYQQGEMPDKKEAAIAILQEWFSKKAARSVSRSAIGEKLKPYFDAFVRKDRK